MTRGGGSSVPTQRGGARNPPLYRVPFFGGSNVIDRREVLSRLLHHLCIRCTPRTVRDLSVRHGAVFGEGAAVVPVYAGGIQALGRTSGSSSSATEFMQ